MAQFASTQLALTYAYEIILVTTAIYFTIGFLLYMVDRWQDLDIKHREKLIAQIINPAIATTTEQIQRTPKPSQSIQTRTIDQGSQIK